MIRYQFRNAKLLFVGINPHPGSYARGVPFSNNKMFWYLLSRAEIIHEDITDLKDDTKLKKIYRTKFNKKYKLGLVNVITRPTHDITQLRKGEETEGQKRTIEIIKIHKPDVVCFIGKIAYGKFTNKKKFSFGWQKDIFSSKAFVMHFPLHGKAIVRIKELKKVARAAQLFS
ncbi:MAG: uracil-DNA glycosylase family protein [Nitrospirota bacterium]